MRKNKFDAGDNTFTISPYSFFIVKQDYVTTNKNSTLFFTWIIIVMKIQTVAVEIPEYCNIIIGQSHFIKTVEDLHEVMIANSTQVKFGLAFCEASGDCLVRHSGNNEDLQVVAQKNALEVGCGHCFIILLKNAYPMNFLNTIRQVPEVCTIYCATANPVEVIVAESEQGRGIIGVIDGFSPKGVESSEDIIERKHFLGQIGYRL